MGRLASWVGDHTQTGNRLILPQAVVECYKRLPYLCAPIARQHRMRCRGSSGAGSPVQIRRPGAKEAIFFC